MPQDTPLETSPNHTPVPPSNGNGQPTIPAIETTTLDFIISHAGAITSKFLYPDNEERKEAEQTLVEVASAQVPNHDPTAKPLNKFLEVTIRKAHLGLLRVLYESDEMSARVNATALYDITKDDLGSGRIIAAFLKISDLLSDSYSSPDTLSMGGAVDRIKLRGVLPTTKNDQNETILHRAIEFLGDRGEMRNKLIFEQYFVADRPAVSIGKDLGIGEAGIISIINRVCARIKKQGNIDASALIENNSRSQTNPPQEKVMSWMAWSDERELPLYKTDVLFALGRLNRWNLQSIDENSPKHSLLKAPVRSFESADLIPFLERLMPEVDETTRLHLKEDQVRLIIEGELTPRHMQILAIVDYILENNSYKTFHRLRLATGSTRDYGDLIAKATKLARVIEPSESITSDGEVYDPSEIIAGFSRRELEVLSLIGHRRDEIAAELDISGSTARTYVHNIIKKTGLEAEPLTILSYELEHLNLDEATERSLNASYLQSLSSREKECAALLAEGMEYEEIANELGLEKSTVRTHLHNLYSKLRVDNSRAAALSAYVRGYIGLPQKVSDFIKTHSSTPTTDPR